jgi:hypothetical protein
MRLPISSPRIESRIRIGRIASSVVAMLHVDPLIRAGNQERGAMYGKYKLRAWKLALSLIAIA